MALQIRRGTNAERQTITPAAGELIFTTDTKKLYIGDGSTAGGVVVDSAILAPVHTSSPDNRPTGVKGLIIFNDSTGKFQGYNGTTWVDLS
jgi:hypothetical protein